jgi:hypothetical protein
VGILRMRGVRFDDEGGVSRGAKSAWERIVV